VAHIDSEVITPRSGKWAGLRISDLWADPGPGDDLNLASSGLVEQFADRGWRTFIRFGGRGTVDRVRVRDTVDVNVMNYVLPTLERQEYLVDEPLLMLCAAMSCDVVYRVEGQQPLRMNRPELTLISVPRGQSLTVDVQGGVPQQRLFGLFRHAALGTALGIDPARLPGMLGHPAHADGTFGRLVSLPLEQHIARLVADTIDTPLVGAMKALQYEGRIIELVAHALQALAHESSRGAVREPQKGLKNGREADLVQRARHRLSLEFRHPPDLDRLAHELGTNRNKLRAAFKTAYGITMAEYCLQCRMREAQKLLLQDRLSIAQVGEQVGYEFPSGFTAAFTAHVGMSPREYRRHRPPTSVPPEGAERAS
jgi:AraC-like DNA-binding protein